MKWKFLVTVTAFAVCSARGQESAAPTPSPAPAATPATDEPVFELSPFEVNTDADIGYLGQNTLAGSRLRTNLKDVAAAISPMTTELISDIAATNVVEAMEYGVNARVETDDGRAAGPVADSYNNAIREIRIRGLPGGSRTVNFFRTLGEIDSYNVDRFDLSRGPNSILYGFGSPAGVINGGTKQARLDKDTYILTLRGDSWDGFRATMDANVPIVQDKLALRAIYLYGREDSWRAAGHKDQDRIFLTGTWKIDRKTNLRLDYEYMDMDRYVPRPFYGVNTMSIWEDAGSPSFINFRDDWASQPAGALGTPGNPYKDSGATAVTGVKQISGTNWVVMTDYSPNAQDYRYMVQPEFPTTPYENDFERGRLNPKADLQANWGGGLWKMRTVSATFQRELTRDLNLEVGFNDSTLDQNVRDLSSWNTYGPTGDPNLYYPDGTLRPAEKSIYFESKPINILNEQSSRQYRATLAYEKEYSDWARLRLAGLVERLDTGQRVQRLEQYWFQGPEVTSPGAFNPDPLNSANRVYHRSYVTDPALLLDRDYRIPGPFDLSGGVPYYDPQARSVRTIYANYINRDPGNIDFYDEVLKTRMIVAQFYTWRDRLAITAGFRRDSLKHYETYPIRDPQAVALGNVGIWIPVDPPDVPSSEYDGDTKTVGGVFHVTQWFSVFYNKSTSVNVPGEIRVFGEDPASSDPDVLAPLRDGDTQDFGFKLDLLDSKLFVTATRFETSAHNDVGFSGFQARGDIVAIWRTLSESKALPADEQAIADAMYQYTNRTQGYLLDSKTEGYELEITGQPLPGWSVTLNYALTESTRENIAPRVRAHIDQWKPLWLKYREWNSSQNSNIPGPEIGNTFEDFNTVEVINTTDDFTKNTDTINERIADVESKFFSNPHLFEGNRYIGDNKHNLNIRTRYDFRSGPLKGFGIGGGMRLRTGRVAGAISEYAFLPDTSYTDAWNGRTVSAVQIVEADDQALFDLQLIYRMKLLQKKVDWTIQLNVNNLFDEDAFIVNNTHPRTGEPVTYRYQDPRQFILTSTFKF